MNDTDVLRWFMEELLISSMAQKVRFAMGEKIHSLIGNQNGRSKRSYRKEFEKYNYEAQAYIYSQEFIDDCYALGIEHPEAIVEYIQGMIEEKGIPIQTSLLEMAET